MQIEEKEKYYSYIVDLQALGIAHFSNCKPELMKKFPELDESKADRLINMYITEQVETKKHLLTE